MSNVWVFGTYKCYNTNLDETRISDRFNAKWRSQVAVPSGSVITGSVEDWFYINGNVHLVLISDLDYQLKKTDAVSDDLWIKRVNGAARRTDYDQLGTEPIIRFEYNGQVLTNPNPTNPNPPAFVSPTPTPKSLVNLGYLSFAEERLELGYDYGAVGGMGYQTEITEVADDREQRNATRYLPRGRWQLGDRLIADSEADLLQEVSYLKQFHLDRLGSFQGFRFKDWSDFQGTNQDIATGNGIKTQFQLRKAYKVGSVVTYRPIQKPVVGTVDVFVNGVNVATIANHGWVVNHETGVLSNPTPLANGAKLTANFQFDVPVWFESDEIGFRLEAYEPESKNVIYRLESVFVVEGRIPPAITWDVQPLTEITEELDLGIIYETTEQYQFSTVKQELKSGYAIRESKREDSRLLVNLGGRNYDQAEVDKILAYFWNARGSLAEFPFKNLGKSYKVRFDQDQLNFKFEAASDSDKFFNLSGLKLQLKPGSIYQVPPFNFQFSFKTIVPTNLNDAEINQSNPGNTSISSPSSSVISEGSKIESYTADYLIGNYAVGTSFNQSPPGSASVDTVNWVAAQLFWAAGTLYLIAQANNNVAANINWFLRGALYKMNSNGNFEYVDSNLKNYFGQHISNPVRCRIFKTPTGVSVFFPADNSVLFGNGAANSSDLNLYGLVRFEIRPDGTEFIDFIPRTILSGFTLTFGSVVAVYGDRVYVNVDSSTSNIIKSSGIRNGVNYVFGNFGNGQAGFPVNVSSTNPANETTKQTEPNNIYVGSNSSQPRKDIYHELEQIESYFADRNNAFGEPDLSKVHQSIDGSILFRIYEAVTCPTYAACAQNSAGVVNISSFWLKKDFLADPVLLSRINIGNNTGDSIWLLATTLRSASGTRINNDQFGNALLITSSGCHFYRAATDHAINITSLTGNNLKCNDTITPYGFAIFANQSFLFRSGSNPRVIFVQPQSS